MAGVKGNYASTPPANCHQCLPLPASKVDIDWDRCYDCYTKWELGQRTSNTTQMGGRCESGNSHNFIGYGLLGGGKMIYAGLYKVSCDMCRGLVRPEKTIIHTDGSKADICNICYGKCLSHNKFNAGVKDGNIKVVQA